MFHINIENHNCKIFNKYDLSGEYGIGYTSKGEEFYFDLEDYKKMCEKPTPLGVGWIAQKNKTMCM